MGGLLRLWANWAALRYGFPPFVRVKPRLAGTSYAGAAMLSMRGDHTVATAAFKEMLDDYPVDLR